MNPVLSRLAPTATNMIRMDHSTVVSQYHQIDRDTSSRQKQALANSICLSIEIHAQLEEEIFYPALRAAGGDAGLLDRTGPEHDEMRACIARLRALPPEAGSFDEALNTLMRLVLHHAADEETILLPQAETLLAGQLTELGAQMTKRCLQLMAPHSAEMVANTARAMPMTTVVMTAAALMAGGFIAKRAWAGGRNAAGGWRGR